MAEIAEFIPEESTFSPETVDTHTVSGKIPGLITVSDIQAYVPDSTGCLVTAKGSSVEADGGHIYRGPDRVHLVAGYGGVGKSRAVLNLAVCGVTGKDWLGYEVVSKFKTLFITTENGMIRLKKDLAGHYDRVKDHIFFYNPPDGIIFDDPDFRELLREIILENKIGLLVLDPWSEIVPDTDHKNYRKVLGNIRDCLPEDVGKCPAIMIIAHLRKPDSKAKRKRGATLMHEVSGSQYLVSKSRCVIVMDHVNPSDEEDNRVVAICAKSNDAEAKPKGCYRRGRLSFDLEPDFDWSEYDQPGKPGAKPRYDIQDVVELLEPGEIIKSGDWKSLAKKTHGIGESRFYEFQKQAVSDGLVTKLEKAQYQRPEE